MASIFNTLSIGYSGLSTAQVGINTTGHNIANAENEGYTRQRVVTSAANPLITSAGDVGNGVEVQDIKRVFDNFVFDRYNSISSDKEYSDFERQTLEELSTYFPEVDGVGIKADLAEYYNMWQTFADNPDNDSIKVALAKQTETLTEHITQTQNQVLNLQMQVNDQLSANITEVNSLAQQLADLNISIDTAESGGGYSANDLRDKRNIIEKSLSRLIGAEVNQGQLESNIQIDSNSNTRTGSYTLSVNGFNLVDGNTFHPLHIEKGTNPYGFYELSYERQDGTLIPLEEKINGGKIGAIFNLRGGAIDTTSGMPTDGVLQNVVADFDAFAKGLIESTNNLYAKSARSKMESNNINLNPASSLVSSSLNINPGSFDMIVYDIDGNEVAKRTIDINAATSMSGVSGSNSIQGQIIANKDDNSDANANNDIDDYINFNYTPSATGDTKLELSMDTLAESQGYTFAIVDNLLDGKFASGTNFAGAIGLGSFFEGTNARDIKLNSQYSNNPTGLHAGYSSNAGDNRVALDMVQQQFESYKFKVSNEEYDATTYGMFDITSTFVGISTNSAITRNETVSTQFNATEMEYNSITKVSIDEEMTNLIKYQTSYGAAAKVITTVDQMMQTLLGIKQ
ncbi:flagellar hook-associated protein FlgK [Sulfurimonas autotrophica]|uniref:Flagellar hook-associated protein 1 n=1 Tax=Sulfurimonas autotrophica (strain ATCC BAA-671 / DSM 16294 / JCM 11897 / OK10) TaxID=563040 RepID=E0UV48_SULAO|nr:flagellar hook-associated protein FlgK [Sulfurimonas autotrophica]ADN09630.1 flagellar hook-associated protein FlgK [Sulfurimonas autotrophica DSM 16294]